jgi:hypothetical protein
VFRREQLRLERFSVEAHYHSAYNFWGLRGVIAERWAHGPYFGAFAEPGPQQVTLTPASDRPNPLSLQAFYGLKSSGFNFETVQDTTFAKRLANEWFADVFEVLKPRRTVALSASWFQLYPAGNPERASRKLRDAYYGGHDAQLSRLKPARFSSYHSAVEMLMVQGPIAGSVIIGVVGPPHRGQFFANDISDRDSRWWVGVRYNLRHNSDDGIEDPVAAIENLIDESARDLDQIALAALPRIVE